MSLSLFCSGTTGGLSLPFHMFLHVPCTGSCLQPGSRTQYQISVTRSSLRLIQVALRHQRAFPLFHPFPEVSLYLVPVPGRGRSAQKYWRPLTRSALLQAAAAAVRQCAAPVCATPVRYSSVWSLCVPVCCSSVCATQVCATPGRRCVRQLSAFPPPARCSGCLSVSRLSLCWKRPANTHHISLSS